tara:strand:- start:2631 stop:2861 length:231 start_codon:yes stop_codon:yes gene_type:complete
MNNKVVIELHEKLYEYVQILDQRLKKLEEKFETIEYLRIMTINTAIIYMIVVSFIEITIFVKFYTNTTIEPMLTLD